jgi:hypothetical protein
LRIHENVERILDPALPDGALVISPAENPNT